MTGSERGTRTLVRMCHNFENFVLVKKSFDDKTELWETQNSFIVSVNYIELLLKYTKNRTIFFNLKKRQKSRCNKKVSICSSILWMYYSNSNKKAGSEKIGKANKKIFCRLRSWLHWNLGESIGAARRSWANIWHLKFQSVAKWRNKNSGKPPVACQKIFWWCQHRWNTSFDPILCPRQEVYQVISTLKYNKTA